MIGLLLAAQTYLLADAIAPVPANCANATIGAAIRTPVNPIYPDSAHGIGAVTVLIRVTVNADASVNALQIEKSSGNAAIDDAAMRAARASTYTSTFINCVPVDGGTYTYRADFNGPMNASSAASPPASGCPMPPESAAITYAAPPAYPASARALGLDVIVVLVEVTVSPSGTAVAGKLNRSSGNAAIDQAALRAARDSRYAPRLLNCMPTTGDVIVREVFDPSAPSPSASP